MSSGKFFSILTRAIHHFLLTAHNHKYHQVMKLGMKMIVSVVLFIWIFNFTIFCMLFKIKYTNMYGKKVPGDIYPNW